MRGHLPRAVMYHYVRDSDTIPRVGYRGLSPAVFAAQLDDICRVATPVGWTAVLAAIRGGPALPSDAVVLTFDDGLRDHHDVVLPLLEARGVPAVFFVLAREPRDGLTLGHRIHVLLGTRTPATLRDEVLARLDRAEGRRFRVLHAASRRADPADPEDAWKRPLQREMAAVAGPILRELVTTTIGPEPDIAAALYLDEHHRTSLVEAGMALGGHGRDHPWLDAVGGADLDRELGRSAATLVRHATAPWPFAYPYGGVPREPGAALGRHGFAAAFTTSSRSRDRFRIGRFDGDDIGGQPVGPWFRRR